jgi:hypothetical protein
VNDGSDRAVGRGVGVMANLSCLRRRASVSGGTVHQNSRLTPGGSTVKMWLWACRQAAEYNSEIKGLVGPKAAVDASG